MHCRILLTIWGLINILELGSSISCTQLLWNGIHLNSKAFSFYLAGVSGPMGHNGLNKIESGQFCEIPKVYASDKNKFSQLTKLVFWKKELDQEDEWKNCPRGFFLGGVIRSHDSNTRVSHMVKGVCKKPAAAPYRHGDCYRLEVNTSDSDVRCRHQYFLRGLLFGKCKGVACVKKAVCCQMLTKSDHMDTLPAAKVKIMDETLSDIAHLAHMLGYMNVGGCSSSYIGEDFNRMEDTWEADHQDCKDNRLRIRYGNWRVVIRKIHWETPVIENIIPEIADSGTINNTSPITAQSTLTRTASVTTKYSHSSEYQTTYSSSISSSISSAITASISASLSRGSSTSKSKAWNVGGSAGFSMAGFQIGAEGGYNHEDTTTTTEEQSFEFSNQAQFEESFGSEYSSAISAAVSREKGEERVKSHDFSSTVQVPPYTAVDWDVIMSKVNVSLKYTITAEIHFSVELNGFLDDNNFHYQYRKKQQGDIPMKYSFGNNKTSFSHSLKEQSDYVKYPWLWADIEQKYFDDSGLFSEVIERLTDERRYEFRLSGRVDRVSGKNIEMKISEPRMLPNEEGARMAKEMTNGTRVVRGQHWEWGNQDGPLPSEGTVTRSLEADHDGWVKVRWDTGDENDYRMGYSGMYDLKIAPKIADDVDMTTEQVKGKNQTQITDSSVTTSETDSRERRRYPSFENVSLVGGKNRRSGTVVVSHGGKEGVVCGKDWSMKEGHVLCRMAGYPGAYAVHKDNHFDYSLDATIVMGDVKCEGTETDLTSCPHTNHGVSRSCSRGSIAGVECKGFDDPVSSVSLTETPDNERGGIVEVTYLGQKGVLCGDHFSDKDAAVVCRMLNFKTPFARHVSVTDSEIVSRYEGMFMLHNISCTGLENNIVDCGGWSWQQHQACGYTDASVAAVDCTVNGKWGSWSDYSECSKTCGTGQQTRSRSCDNPAPENGGDDCEGERTESRNCNTDACPAPPLVRLVGGPDARAGTVVVKKDYNETEGVVSHGDWGGGHWGYEDARVVCNMLGFTDASPIPYRNNRFNTPVTKDMRYEIGNVRCTGLETSLWDCPSDDSRLRGRNHEAGVSCYAPPSPRTKTYTFHTDDVTYAAARSSCAAKGQRLAMPKTKAELAALWAVLYREKPGGAVPWIDLRLTESGWQWGDGEEAEWTDWMRGEPSGDKDYKCVTIDWYWGGWKNVPCTRTRRYMCEADI